MPRYIDTSKVRIPEGFFDDLNVPKLLNWLNNQPTAELVPKSEVEKLQEAYNNRLAKDIQTNADFVKYAKAEVAREIFAEIDRLMLDGVIGEKYPAKVINPDKYAELKKKYTEEPR